MTTERTAIEPDIDEARRDHLPFAKAFIDALRNNRSVMAATLTGKALRGAETKARNWIGVLIGFVFRHHGPAGALARSVQAGSMAFWMIVLLGAYLVLYLV